MAASEKWVWEWQDDQSGATPGHDVCTDAQPSSEAARGVELDLAGAEWELTAVGGDVTIDQTTLRSTR